MRINVDAGEAIAPLKPFWTGQCNPMIETGADGDRPLYAWLCRRAACR